LVRYFPGHIHAFYLEYVYYDRRKTYVPERRPAPGVYSKRIQTGGHHLQPAPGYGTME
jgi:hypothetical protein